MAERSDDELQRDLESKEFQHGVEQCFWALLERKDHLVYVNFYDRDRTVFLMQLECDGYGRQAIGGKFVDPKTRLCASSAWPRGDSRLGDWLKWDPQHLFICWPGDRYGINHHPDWAAQQFWKRPPNPIVSYADFIRRLLWIRACGYTGKAA